VSTNLITRSPKLGESLWKSDDKKLVDRLVDSGFVTKEVIPQVDKENNQKQKRSIRSNNKKNNNQISREPRESNNISTNKNKPITQAIQDTQAIPENAIPNSENEDWSFVKTRVAKSKSNKPEQKTQSQNSKKH